MEWERRFTAAGVGARSADLSIPVGASFAFDPGADGLAGIYAIRVLDRGIDPRALSAEVRADRRGIPEHPTVVRSLLSQPRAMRFGRGTAAHLQATAHPAPRSAPRPRSRPRGAATTDIVPSREPRANWPRRLAAAGLALLVLLPLTAVF
jgi:hypothetical protein